MVSVLFVYMSDTVYDEFAERDLGLQSGRQSEIMNNTFMNVKTSFDSLPWITFFLLIGMAIAIFISSFFTQTSPVFFVAYILILIIAVIVAVPIANTVDELTEDELLDDTWLEFYTSTYILLWMPHWVTVIGIVGGIILYIRMVNPSEFVR